MRLALSLHAPEDALRSELMPVNERYPLRDVLDACLRWHERRRRAVFVEYLMLDGINDRVGRDAIEAFRAALVERGVRTTVRLTRGRDIDAACGQLAARSA